jgi:RHS repeat-associated protein
LEQGVYPGIDVLWHSAPASGELEYDFQLAPGADPSLIRLHIDGATSLDTDAQGDLLVHTAGGTLVQRAPVLTQTAAPGAAPIPVAGSAVLLPGGDLGFRVGTYDPARPLTIDPVLGSSYLGGTGSDQAFAVAADGSGDAYVAGITNSTDFPTSTGAYQTSNAAAQALFVTKVNPSGTAYVYSTYIAGVNFNSSNLYGLAVDAGGAAYVTGTTSNSNFPTTQGAYQTSVPGGGGGAFVSKLSATGDALIYSSFFGPGGTTTTAIAVDPEGSAYLTGNVTSGSASAFPTTGGAFQTSASGVGAKAFVSKLNPAGSGLAYSSFLSGSGTDQGYGIAVDDAGEAFVTGATTSSNFPTTAGAYKTSNSSFNSVAFVSKLNAAGSALSYSSYLGGSGGDQGNAIAIDAAGDAFVTGSTSSTNFPTTAGAPQTSPGGGGDAFATKLNPGGTGLAFSTYLGGSGADSGAGIAVAPSGEAVLTGTTASSGGLLGTPFPTTSGALQSAYGGGLNDGFVTRLGAAGTSLVYSSYLGGSSGDAGAGAAVDAFGNAYLAGYTQSSNFPTVHAQQGSSAGGFDAWSVQLSPLPAAPVFTGVANGTSTSFGVVTPTQNLTISGTSDPSATVTVSRSDLGVLGTTTANGGGSWSYNYTGTTLAEGTYSFTATQTVSGVTGNPTAAYVVSVDATAPTLALTAPGATTSLGPVVQVATTDLNGLPDGTTVTIDVDKNNNGSFADPGESGYATGTLSGGAASVVLPALAGTGTYPVRARVTDQAGNQQTSATATVMVNSATSWSATAQVLTSDPQAGDAQDQLGNVQLAHSLNLDLSGGGQSGGAALIYNSDSTNVKPIIQATLQSPNNAALPATVTAVLTWNGAVGATLTYSTSGLAKGDSMVIAAQVPTAVTTTGAYSWSLAVVASGNNLSASGTAYVVTQDSSVFGAGWTFAPVDQLYSVTGGVLRAYGTGEWSYYASLGGGAFTSPAGDNGTLSQTGGTYTYSTPDGQTRTFDSNGYQTGWASADGQSLLTYTYSGGNLATMQAVDGTTTTFNYSAGKVSTLVTGNNRTTTLAYSGSNLTQVTNPDGGVHTFAYDGNHHVTGETFANLQNSWSYSNGALATMTWGSNGSPSVTGYSPAAVQGLSAAVRSAVAQQTDALGDVTQWQLDAAGRPTQQTAPNGAVTTWKRDGNGYVTSTTDPLRRTTTLALDAAGYTTQVTNPDATSESYAYQSSFHALTTMTDARGQTSTFAYDGSGHQTSATDPLGKRTTTTYLGNGKVESVTDPNNHTTTYAYDAVRRLTKITDAAGGVTTLTYDANGFEQTRIDPLGRTTTTLHDVMGRVTGTTDPAGGTTAATYNAAGLQLTATDALGRQTNTIYDSSNRGLMAQTIQAVGTGATADTVTSYDAVGRVSQSRDTAGWVTTFAYGRAGQQTQANDALGAASPSMYDLAGQQTSSRNGLGSQASSAYDLRGRVTVSTDALGNSRTSAFDAAGNETSTTDALSHTATTLYDAAGRATTNIDALGNRTTTTYDAAGNVSTVTDARGTVTSYAYDALNRRTMMTEAVGTGVQRTSTVAYDKAGNVTSATDTLGHVMTYRYDALNRRTESTDALSHTVTTTYDAAGNVSTVKDALGNVTTYLYDAQNRQTAVTDPLGHTVTTLYDAAGRAVQTIDALGDVSRVDYNALGQEVAAVDALGKVTQYGYDSAGNRAKLVDPDGNTTTWAYDALGRQVNAIDPFGSVTTTAYDAASRVTSVTDRLGRVMTYAYDAANRLTASTWKAAGGSTANVQTFTYDANGNQLTAADYSGTYTNSYDVLNRLTAQTDPFSVALTFAYDAANRLTTLQDSLSGTTTSVYDNANRLTTREFGGPGQTPLRMDPAYDNANRLTGLTRYSNLAGNALVGTTSYSYDAASRVTSIVNKDSTPATVSYYNYQYDNANRVTVQSGTGATGTYSYDAASQVLGDGNTAYSFDANGNRTMAGYQTGTDNQTTNDGTFTYTYDAVGNLTQKSKGSGQETWMYTYDNENHLTVVRKTSNGSTNQLLVTYAYDVYGQRIQEDKWTSGGSTVTTRFVWSGTQVVMDLNGSNVVQERYLWGDMQDQLFARIDGNGTAHWYLTDRLGSVRDMVNASGASEDHTDYTAFGVIITQTSASAQGRFCWTSKDFDPQTGLQYNLARYYSPAAGTWSSQDPIGFQARDANLYRYVSNMTLMATDPSGTVLAGSGSPSGMAATAQALADLGMLGGAVAFALSPITYEQWVYTPVTPVGINGELDEPGGALIPGQGSALAPNPVTQKPPQLQKLPQQQQKGNKACFAAGTPVLTPSGYTTIERLRPGDQVLSRIEGDVRAETVVTVVEEAFVHVAAVVRLRVAGRDIHTTAEHPFFVVGHGWRPANELRPGDRLSSHDGRTVEVESVAETGETVTVYNVSLADYHTYFVGCDEWGFSVWAHNACLVLKQVQPGDTDAGMAYAIQAWVYRAGRSLPNAGSQPNLTYWQSGGHNIGYIATKNLPGNRIYVSGRTGDSEQQMRADPRLSGVPTTDQVISIFTERSPCPVCLPMLEAWIAPQQQPDTVICYYVIPYVAGSRDNQGAELLARYRQLGSANW